MQDRIPLARTRSDLELQLLRLGGDDLGLPDLAVQRAPDVDDLGILHHDEHADRDRDAEDAGEETLHEDIERRRQREENVKEAQAEIRRIAADDSRREALKKCITEPPGEIREIAVEDIPVQEGVDQGADGERERQHEDADAGLVGYLEERLNEVLEPRPGVVGFVQKIAEAGDEDRRKDVDEERLPRQPL